jgi:hypothetical protein
MEQASPPDASSDASSEADASPAPDGGDATGIVVGVLTYDVTMPKSASEFDITNLTGDGGISSVSTAVSFSDLTLTVAFSDGTTRVMGPATFTRAADDASWNGGTIAIGGQNPQPTEATLVGTLTPTNIVADGGAIAVRAAFGPVRLSAATPPNLADGDHALITAAPIQ